MNRARVAAFVSGLMLACAGPGWAADAPCPASFAEASGPCDQRVSAGARACVYPQGTWPDGSRKGRFSCASAGIPGAAPARGM